MSPTRVSTPRFTKPTIMYTFNKIYSHNNYCIPHTHHTRTQTQTAQHGRARVCVCMRAVQLQSKRHGQSVWEWVTNCPRDGSMVAITTPMLNAIF